MVCFAGVYLCWGGLSAAWKFFGNFLRLPLSEWDDLQVKIASPIVTQTTEEAKKGIRIRQVFGLKVISPFLLVFLDA